MKKDTLISFGIIGVALLVSVYIIVRHGNSRSDWYMSQNLGFPSEIRRKTGKVIEFAESGGRLTNTTGLLIEEVKILPHPDAQLVQRDPWFQIVAEDGTPRGIVGEMRIDEWMSGFSVDEGDEGIKKRRAETKKVLDEIYKARAITENAKKNLDLFEAEFLGGFFEAFFADFRYFESADGESRGFSFIQFQGAERGIIPEYFIILYNPERNVLIHLVQTLPFDAQEVQERNALIPRFEGEGKTNAELDMVDQNLKEEFKNFLETTSRSALSFGRVLNNLDRFMKTLIFR